MISALLVSYYCKIWDVSFSFPFPPTVLGIIARVCTPIFAQIVRASFFPPHLDASCFALVWE